MRLFGSGVGAYGGLKASRPLASGMFSLLAGRGRPWLGGLSWLGTRAAGAYGGWRAGDWASRRALDWMGQQ